MEIWTVGTVAAPARVVHALQRSADSPLTPTFSEEQVLTLEGARVESDAPTLRVAELHAVQRLEAHEMSSAHESHRLVQSEIDDLPIDGRKTQM